MGQVGSEAGEAGTSCLWAGQAQLAVCRPCPGVPVGPQRYLVPWHSLPDHARAAVSRSVWAWVGWMDRQLESRECAGQASARVPTTQLLEPGHGGQRVS